MKKEWEEWKKFYRDNQGLMDGALLYTILLILAFIVLVGFLKIPDATVTGAGQFFADWLLFPTVIIGFYIAIKEFRKSQSLPKLEIFWSGDAGVIKDENAFILPAHDTSLASYRLLLHVHNTGELITIWYRVAVDLPTELFALSEIVEVDAAGNRRGIYELRWHLGNADNWGDNVNLQRRQYEFKSNGQQALYPGQSVHIATLEVTIPESFIQKPRQSQIKYSIVTDVTKMDCREQVVHIIKDDLLPSRLYDVFD